MGAAEGGLEGLRAGRVLCSRWPSSVAERCVVEMVSSILSFRCSSAERPAARFPYPGAWSALLVKLGSAAV